MGRDISDIFFSFRNTEFSEFLPPRLIKLVRVVILKTAEDPSTSNTYGMVLSTGLYKSH